MLLLIVHDKFPTSQEMCLSLDSTQESASIVTQLWHKNILILMEWEGGGCWACFPPFPSLCSSAWARSWRLFLLGVRWALLLVGVLYALPIPCFRCYILGPIYLSRALVELSSGSVNLAKKAWESEQNCSSASMSSIRVSWEGWANGFISFFLLLVYNYCALEAAATCTSRKFRFYNF